MFWFVIIYFSCYPCICIRFVLLLETGRFLRNIINYISIEFNFEFNYKKTKREYFTLVQYHFVI